MRGDILCTSIFHICCLEVEGVVKVVCYPSHHTVVFHV